MKARKYGVIWGSLLQSLGIITLKYKIFLRISPRKRKSFQKYFTMWIQGPGTRYYRFMQKTRHEKSHATVPLTVVFSKHFMISFHCTSKECLIKLLRVLATSFHLVFLEVLLLTCNSEGTQFLSNKNWTFQHFPDQKVHICHTVLFIQVD